MRLSSVRDLKSELFADVARPLLHRVLEDLPHAPALSRVGGAKRRGLRTGRSIEVARDLSSPGFALGVARSGPNAADFKLAVRGYADDPGAAIAILRRIGRHASECDVALGIHYRPRATLRAGGSCGHFQITAGTLGAFVEDDADYYILSNNHVLANSSAAQRGDHIYQPGPVDIVDDRFLIIGELERWIPLSPLRRDGVDAAIARFSSEVEHFYPWRYQGIGDMRPLDFQDRFEVEHVTKRGRTTGVTRGSVSAYELDGVQIDYAEEHETSRIITFDDQLEIVGTPKTRPFSAAGDSGSLILEQGSRRPYALLFGGGLDERGIDRTLAHFVPDVLRNLGVRWVK
jgi:hypothetical protein